MHSTLSEAAGLTGIDVSQRKFAAITRHNGQNFVAITCRNGRGPWRSKDQMSQWTLLPQSPWTCRNGRGPTDDNFVAISYCDGKDYMFDNGQVPQTKIYMLN